MMNPQLFYMGITHRGAPLSIRERVRPDPEQQLVMLGRFEDLAAERMMLCTCERFEIYALTADTNVFAWVGRVASALPFQVNLLEKHAAFIHGRQVTRQLLRVAAGLESRIVGEPHILEQVREAYSRACESRSVGPVLSALAGAAIHAGERVRGETPLGRERCSVVTVAIGHTERELGSLRDRTVLVVGTGRLASDLVNELTVREPHLLVIAGRNLKRAKALAQKVSGEGVGMNRLAEAVGRSDVIITCSGSRTPVISRPMLPAVVGKDRWIVDLAVPRNVHPLVAELPGVRLVHMDELLALESDPGDGVVTAEGIVEEELQRFEQRPRERRSAPTIPSFEEQARAAKADFTREDRSGPRGRIKRPRPEVAS
jgi:glutamyl-tRNA reductase